jgi:hypothetical protein
MDLISIRDELCQMRRQIQRQRKEIRKLQLAGVPTLSAEELLARMQARVIALRQERARQVDERRRQNPAADKVNKRPFQKRIR